MIADFVVGQMTAYIAGGMKPETAAKFTRGELLSIYRGDHYGRDAAGKPQKTPPPENLDIKTAMRKADAGIAEILKCYADDAKKALEKPIQQGLNGFEKMAEYARSPV
jgi:hypothetical protein